MISSLFKPIDAAILIYFRIGAGILIAQELINAIIIGKFNQYVLPQHHFSYMYFEWIKPWPYWGMIIHYGITIFSGFAVACNYRYQLFSKVLFLGVTLLFLFDQTEYINHHYLYCLISFWLMVLPLDEKKSTSPAWMLYLILFHMGLAYFFGGIAKLNPDWLSGTPMDIFLEQRKSHPLSFFYSTPWAAYFFSYGGLFFDLLIVPLMIFQQTRILGLTLSVIFHLSNVIMFGLATFPWFSLLLTTMFFDPSWPRKIKFLQPFLPERSESPSEYSINKLLVAALGVYVFIHLTLPFRHFLYQGVTSWTEQGHMFAWRMMLRHKKGNLKFMVVRKDTQEFIIPDPLLHITQRQYDDIIGNPDLILSFAHYLRDYYQNTLKTEVSVYATSKVSLNGRPFQEMIKSGTDLAQEKRSLLGYKWVQPLSEMMSSL